MPKAIKITNETKNSLLAEYNFEEPEDLDDFMGLYLVADFGEDKPILGYLTKAALEHTFDRTDETLENGYFGIHRKVVGN